MDTIIDFIHSIDNNIASFMRYIVYDSDPVTGLALMFAIPTMLAAGLVWGFELLKYLKDADTLIQNSDCNSCLIC